jgi:hypothetical protein
MWNVNRQRKSLRSEITSNNATLSIIPIYFDLVSNRDCHSCGMSAESQNYEASRDNHC